MKTQEMTIGAHLIQAAIVLTMIAGMALIFI